MVFKHWLGGRVIGGVVGSTGGFFTGLVGQEVGAQIADIITNNQLGSALKMRMVSDLTDNPEVLKKVNELLSKTASYTPPKLPVGKSYPNPKESNYIPPKLPAQRLPDEKPFQRLPVKESQAIPIKTTATTVTKNIISPIIPQTKPKVNAVTLPKGTKTTSAPDSFAKGMSKEKSN